MLWYFILFEKIDLADITETKFDDIRNQVNDYDLQIGEDARSLLNTMMEDGMVPDITKLIVHVCLFYTK